MLDESQKQRLRELKASGRTPKEIARSLGVRRSDLEPLLREEAARAAQAHPSTLVGCWLNAGWSSGLSWVGHPEWTDPTGSIDGIPRLSTVVIARTRRYDKLSVATFLVDPQCLGVKNAIPPRVLDRLALREYVGACFSTYGEPPLEIALDLATHLVHGAVAYARTLGFEPHPDFERARDHLGAWDGPSPIRFGHGGKPVFIQGPQDDPWEIVRTLERSVGRGNFEVVLAG